ncbi:MAG: hypothetical protein ACO1QR_04130 [Chthoniobacteraceae bacterium]
MSSSPIVQSIGRPISPLVRWTVFAVSVALIAYILFKWIPTFTAPTDHWSDRLISALFVFCFSWPFLLTAYASYREQYLRAWKVISFIAAAAATMALMAAMNYSNADKYLLEPSRDHPWLIFIGFPVSLLLFFGPVWAGIWLYFRSVQAGRRYLKVSERIAVGERAVEEGRVLSHEDAEERMERGLR